MLIRLAKKVTYMSMNANAQKSFLVKESQEAPGRTRYEIAVTVTDHPLLHWH